MTGSAREPESPCRGGERQLNPPRSNDPPSTFPNHPRGSAYPSPPPQPAAEWIVVNLNDQPKTIWKAMAVTKNIRPQWAAPIKKICVSGIVNVIFHSPGVGLQLPLAPVETVEMKVLRLCRAQARLWERLRGNAALSCEVLCCASLPCH